IEPFPPRLAIVGGGPVALEFAGMFAQFGSQVTLITRGQRILTGEDDDVAESVHQALAAAGVQIRTGVDVLGMDDDGTHVDVRTSREPVAADAVLVAAGRVPATEGLALERAGIDDGPEGEVVVDAGSDEVLGGALHTVDAQELVNLIALAMRTGTTASQLRDGIWTHPSTTEALNEVLASPRD
ncbi:MAG TPA: FAD-dependent oxidoreductase, partial [Beutenbergiaceae bacterium]|nr:FAD-dependent oxidoreductase [Beutenbergiaceae bacterium]